MDKTAIQKFSNEAAMHVPTPLSDLSVKVMQSASEYNINRALFPARNVTKMSDRYYVYNIADAFRVTQDIRANASESGGIDALTLTSPVYVMNEHSLHEMVSDRDRQNADPAVDPEMDAVEDVTTIIARNKELECARMVFTTTTFGGGNRQVLSSNAFDLDTVTSSPIDAFDTARANVLLNTGKIPNGSAMGFNTWQVLKDHGDILDRIKFSERGIVGEEIASMVLGIDKINVGRGIRRTTNQGISATTGFIFDNNIVIYYNEPNPRLRSQNFGITFQKADPKIDRIRDDHKKADKVEVTHTYSQNIVLSLSGYLLASVNS